MKYPVAAVSAWALAVIGVSALPYVRILGVTPNLVLVFAACWTMVRPQNEALVVVPLAGLIRDLATADPVGVSVLALAPLVPLAVIFRMQAMDTDFLPTVLLAGAGSIAYGVISTVLLRLTGQPIAWFHAAFWVILPAAVVNALFAPLFYLPLHAFSRRKPWLLGSRRMTASL